jgi:tetratricopeptide (TPR) repeat protein
VTRLTDQTPSLVNESAGVVRLALILIALLIGVAYANSLNDGFVLDDVSSIPENPTIRHLWPMWGSLTPPNDSGQTVGGRPILNLSFALNYSVGGTNVRGYRAANIAIHILAAFALFGIVRRTVGRTGKAMGQDATAIAFFSALIWGLHPLQTESVSYMVQRAESLMGLFFLISLYAVIRGVESEHNSPFWSLLGVSAALLCAGTKEVSVALPLVVLLYDRTFLAGSFSLALHKRRALYVGLAASWLVVAWLAIANGDRGGTIGARAGITPWAYALCQCRGLFHYLRLCFWPTPLIFDYGSNFVSFSEALPWAVVLISILGCTGYGLARRRALGFLGAWFFIILAPTSSIVGGTRQMLAEHRMYLSLGAVVVGAVLLVYRCLGRRTLALGVVVSAALMAITAARNAIYADGFSLARDTVLHRPGNAWAQVGLAGFLADQPGREREALAHYETALHLRPDFAEAHYNLAIFLASQPGREADAIARYETALRLKPDYADAHYNLALLLGGQPSREAEAISHFESALRVRPDFAKAHYNLANLLADRPGREVDAIAHYMAALRLQPEFAEVHNDLALLLAAYPEREAEAIAHYETALRLKPDLAEAHNNLANLLSHQANREADAIAHYEAALHLRPDYAMAHSNLANLLSNHPGRRGDAMTHYEAAVRLLPNNAAIHFNFATELEKIPERRGEALMHYSTALSLDPNLTPAKDALRRLRQTEP